ncbi:hypothetical protein Tco_0764220 [Tanacetum coccineum]
MKSCDPVGTPMKIKDKLDLDQNGSLVDATKYHSMIGALMYLTSSRPDIVHATCLWVSGIRRILAKSWLAGPQRNKAVRHYLYRGIRICVSICLMCPSPLDVDTVNGLWLSLQQDSNPL